MVLEQPWEHLGPIMRMLQTLKAGGNACGFFSPVGTSRGNWENANVIEAGCLLSTYLCFAALLN